MMQARHSEQSKTSCGEGNDGLSPRAMDSATLAGPGSDVVLELTYGVQGIPCLILYKGGEAVDRIVGFVPESKITEMLSRHLAVA